MGTCREKTNTMIDAVSVCKHCDKRFCLKHVQAELHGCGEAAQRTERKKFLQSCDAAMNPRGSGLVNKSVGEHRTQLNSKLQDKIQKQEAARTTQKKSAKK